MKKLLLGLSMIFISAIGFSQQWTYNATYTADGGNPGGINTETDAPGQSVWTTIITDLQPSNIWSPTTAIPIPFDFYGSPVTQFKASLTGLVTFDVSGALPNVPNENLPSANLPNSTICGFWDEFTASAPTAFGDEVRVATFGTAPNRQFWIKWYSFEMGNPTVSFSYFAIVLEESTNNVYVVDQYGSATPSLSFTVGVQENATNATQFGTNMTAQAGNGSSSPDNDFYCFMPELLVDDNAGVLSLDNPIIPLSSGLQNVDVTVRNFGTNDLTSFNVEWEIDGTLQAPFTYSGPTLPSFTNSTSLNLGSYNFPTGISEMKFWTTLPNGVPDANALDDTLTISACTALNGTFTIGGATPDFATISEANDALLSCGISGPVVFNIAPGVYNESITTTVINGSSATNTVTFNGGSAATTSMVANAPAVIALAGADYITWKNLTVENTATTDGFGFHLSDTSDYNTIDSCIIVLDPTATTDVIGIVCSGDVNNDFTEANAANNCTFSNNVISGGEMGIHLEGPTANGSWMSGISILNNDINTMDDYGIYVDNQDSLTIRGNKIYDIRNAQGDGIYCLDIANFDFSYNELFAPDYGIYIADGNFDFAVTGQSSIINNMVKSETDYAIYLDDINNINIYHNTAYGNPGMRINDFTVLDIRNNIFQSDNDYAFEADDATTGNQLDFNLYWTPASNNLFAKDGTSTYVDLAAWQAGSATVNGSSVESEPEFMGPFDLHMNGPEALDIGDNSVGVLDDIDGDVRPLAPSVTVDLGADEYTLPGDNAGVISMDSPIIPLTIGLQNVDVTVSNFGSNDLTSFNIEWEINSVPQTTFTYTGPTIPPYTNSTSLNLGSYTFPAGTTTFKFWTTLPNGVTDTDFTNDTLTLSACTALNGTYTIGGVTPDFATISEANDALLSCGVSGPVVFNIAPGVYNESITTTVINGTSATNTVTFNGGSAATTSMVADAPAVVALAGADYITWKNLTIENTATTDGFGFHLSDTSDYNTIDSCIIVLDPTATTDVIGIVCSGDVNNDFTEANAANNCTFSNNVISGGEMGIHMEGPTANGSWMSGINILNNEIHTIDDYGIYVDNQDSLTIRGNKIYDIRNTQGDGIYCLDIANFDFSYNELFAPDYGIYIADGNFDFAVTGQSSIINNMVKSETDYAIYLDDINNINIYHNTAYGNPGIRINDFTLLDIRNNIFRSDSDYAFESDEDAGTIQIDFNLYWTPVANTLFVKDGATTYVDLAAWQAGSGTNGLSVEAEPFFVSPTDLHNVGTAPNDLGSNVVGVLDDIDGEARPISPSTTVDIGADEYTPIADDAEGVSLFLGGSAPCGDSVTEVYMVFQNLGSNSITSMTAGADVTGDIVTTLNGTYSGSIAFGETDTVLLGTINTYAGALIDVSAWTILTGDGNASNDSVTTSFTVIPFEPKGIDGFGCGADSALISGALGFPVLYNWYDAPTGGNLVGTGNTFMVPSIATQDTYYLEYGQGVADSLVTTYAAGNGCGGGAMFDMESAGGSALFGLRVHSNAAAGTVVPVNVYYLIGSYSGNETNAGAWTSAGSYTPLSGGAGNGSTQIDLNTPILLPAGTSVGIYVEYNAQYTNGSNTYVSGDVTVTTGTGLCSAFGGLNVGREFNGTLLLGGDGCSMIRTPVSAQTVPVPTVDLGVDSTVCALNYTLNGENAHPLTTWNWSDGASGQMNTVSNSGTYWVEVTDSAGCTAVDSVDLFISGLQIDSLMASTDLCAGDSIELSPAVSSNHPYTFVWSSGNLTQDITVNSADTYTFTATDSLGCSLSESAVVTIIDGPVAGFTESITGEILSITSTATGADSTVYDFGDGTVVTDVDPTYSYTANGTYTVCQYVYNDCDSDTICTTVTATGIGIAEIAAGNITLHPNPADAIINITLKDASAEKIKVLTSEGRLVAIYDLSGSTLTIDVANYPTGVYFVNIESTNGTVVKKFIKE